MLQRPPSRADSARSVPASASGSAAGSGSASAASPSLHAIPSPALSATPGVSLDGGPTDACGPGALSQLASAALEQSLDQYRTALKSHPTPELQLEFAHFLIHTAVPECPEIARELRAEATKFTKKAASASGSSLCLTDAQFFLAELYETGAASDKDKPQYDKAFTMYVKAAKHAHMEAAYRVAVYYENGRGTSKSGTRALQFYQKAAALGHPGACYRLGMAELHGELGLDINARNGIKWLKHSATAATPEHCEGLYELAVLHETGIEHVVFIDHEYAVTLLQQAATLGHVKAMYRLGSYHEHGNHVPKNPSTSFAYFQAAAERGHPDSMFGVASWYLTGNREASVPQSDELAFEWMKKAAESGLIKALFALAYLYEEGIGTSENLTEAKAWYEMALAKGDKRAAPRLVAIKQMLERSGRGGGDSAGRRARAGKKRKVPKDLMAGGGGSPAASVSGGSERGTPPGSVSGGGGGGGGRGQSRRVNGVSQQQPAPAPPKKMTLAEREAERERIRRQRTGEDACVVM